MSCYHARPTGVSTSLSRRLRPRSSAPSSSRCPQPESLPIPAHQNLTLGHFRAICLLAAKFVAERPVIVTVLVPHWAKTFDRAQAETARCLADVDNPLGEVRVVALGNHSFNPRDAVTVTVEMFEPIWQRLLAGEPITCSEMGTTYAGAARPSLVILDGFEYPWLSLIRATTADAPIPVIEWSTGFSAGTVWLCLPHSYGGAGEILYPEYTEEERRHGRVLEPSGNLVRMRGIPPMYDWEVFPQRLDHMSPNKPGALAEFLHNFTRFMREADGLATCNAPGYDGEVLTSIDDWMAETGRRPTFHLGPMLPLQPGSSDFSQRALEAEMAVAPPGIGAKVKSFLDSVLKTRGEGSLVYISFGGIFWPHNPEYVWTLLEKLAGREIPFVLTHASPVAQIPEHILNRFENSLDGLFIPYAPQQTILAHKSVGWFVTHGGYGGTIDALAQGVPMVAWPFTGDQPSNVTYMVHFLDVAFELTEVRSGEYGLKSMYHHGRAPKGTIESFKEELDILLDHLTAEAGQRKRVNAKRIQQDLVNAWGKGGSATTAFDELLSRFGL